MIGLVPTPESQHKKQLKQIARIAQYQPIASIPQISNNFNYTLVRNRYSEYYEQPRVVWKSHAQRGDQLKLKTILETHGGSPLFPKILESKKSQNDGINGSLKGKVHGLRCHFKKQNQRTVASHERSLTIDTRQESEQDLKNENLSELLEGDQLDKSNIFSSQDAERNNFDSNSSEVPSLVPSNKYYLFQNHHKSMINPFQEVLNQEQQSEDEYEKDCNPGPGSYYYSYSDFDKKRNTRSTDVSFLSNLTRFKPNQKVHNYSLTHNKNLISQHIEVPQQKQQKKKPRRNLVPFNSNSPRKFQCDERAKVNVPGPQNYFPRQGMEQDLIRSIQRNFKGNFGVNKPRFLYPIAQSSHLGPGSYDFTVTEDLLKGQDFFFKSKKDRFG